MIENVYLWPHSVFHLDLQLTNWIRAAGLWPSSAAGTSWSSSADICLHGSCPLAPPSASTGESSAVWFLDMEAGPAGQWNTGSFYPAQPAPLLALTSISSSQVWGWDMEPSCVKTQYSWWYRWEGMWAGFALVLANKHLNRKVDNWVGWGSWGC